MKKIDELSMDWPGVAPWRSAWEQENTLRTRQLPGLLLFAMSVAASAPAQTGNVGGVIIDDRTQQPIEGVQVYVLNQSATADLDGRTIFAVRAEPKRLPNGAIDFGSFDAPWVNVLDGVAKGLEIIVRRGGTGAFSGWAGYALGRLYALPSSHAASSGCGTSRNRNPRGYRHRRSDNGTTGPHRARLRLQRGDCGAAESRTDDAAHSDHRDCSTHQKPGRVTCLSDSTEKLCYSG